MDRGLLGKREGVLLLRGRLKRGIDGLEGRAERIADRRDGNDDHDRNERGDQAVFDGRGAGLVTNETLEGRHLLLPVISGPCRTLRPALAGLRRILPLNFQMAVKSSARFLRYQITNS